MKAWAGIEPAHGSFADSCVATSPPGHDFSPSIADLLLPQKFVNALAVLLALIHDECDFRKVLEARMLREILREFVPLPREEVKRLALSVIREDRYGNLRAAVLVEEADTRHRDHGLAVRLPREEFACYFLEEGL